MRACRLLYPGGLAGSDRSWAGVFQPVSWSPATTAFPRTQMGRRPRPTFRGLVGCSLALRPACSRDRRCGPLRRRLRRLRYLHRRSDCYRLERTSCRVGVTPTEDLYLFTARCVPVSAPSQRPSFGPRLRRLIRPVTIRGNALATNRYRRFSRARPGAGERAAGAVRRPTAGCGCSSTIGGRGGAGSTEPQVLAPSSAG